MVKNRDIVNSALLSLESKLTALRNCVERQFPVESFIQLVEQCEKHMGTVGYNLVTSRNDDITRVEIGKINVNLRLLREAVSGNYAIEKYIITIEKTEASLEALDQAVQREPLEGFELSKPNRVN